MLLRGAGLSAIRLFTISLLLGACASHTNPTTAPLTPLPTTQPSPSIAPFSISKHRSALRHPDIIESLYAQPDFSPLWLSVRGLSEAGQQLLQQLAETSADEIYPYPYHLDAIYQALAEQPTSAADILALDTLFTDAFISYAEDVFSQRLLPSNMPASTSATQPVSTAGTDYQLPDIAALLNRDTSQLPQLVRQLSPQHPDYARLRRALDFYQGLANSGLWQPLAEGPTLELGMQGNDIAHLRQLLRLYGDYPPRRNSSSHSIPAADQFDHTLELSVRQFQTRHGQTADGKVGRITRRLLNTSPSYRVKQIALTMKRWRELPARLGDRYLWVNLTDYRLQLVEQGEVRLDMRTIVGQRKRPTPVMQNTVNTLVLNPYWNLPRKIAEEDYLPKLRQQPDYLTQRNIKILPDWGTSTPIAPDSIDWQTLNPQNFPYRLRQDPGPGNALGHIKFVIPNSRAIYLHDTNARYLFNRRSRAISSGCIRVEKPYALARYLLRGSDWAPGRFHRTIDSGETRQIHLSQPVPVYLFYTTVWVDQRNTIQFRDDIYRHDQLLGPPHLQAAL